MHVRKSQLPGGTEAALDYRVTFDGTAIASVTALFQAEAPIRNYIDGRVMTFANKAVAVSAWAASTDQSGAGFGFRAAVALAGVTASMVPDVYFSAADAVSANFSPAAQSYAGGVYIYAASKPTAAITIPTIRVTK